MAEHREAAGGASGARRACALLLLCLVCVFNYADRNVITILLAHIKQDLGLSDSQAGLLTGFAFAAVYSVLGVPLARVADRGRRVQVLSAAVAVWSVATMLCSLATSFASMLAARMGVGVGEAGGTAPMQALVSDYFPPGARARALSAIAVSAGVGTVAGLLVGGYLSDVLGWRRAFVLMGLPGLVLACLAYLLLERPPRVESAVPNGAATGLKSTLLELSARKSFLHIMLGLSISAIGLYGISTWTPTFMMREYAASATRVGALAAIVTGPATLLGILLGGFAADALTRRDARWPVWLFIIGFGGVAPLYLLMLLSRQLSVGVMFAVPAGVLGNLWVAPGLALIQNLAGSQSRATAAALFGLAVNLVGLGLGPTSVGVISDLLQPFAGSESLRWAMCIVLVTLLYGVVHFIFAARTVAADLGSVAP